MQVDSEKFRETFFVEAAEHVNAMESALLQLEREPEKRELLEEVFRRVHTIKGASSTFGFADVSNFAHVLENLLDHLREGRLRVETGLLGLLLRAVDVTSDLLEAAQSGKSDPPQAAEVARQLLIRSSECDTSATDGAPSMVSPSMPDASSPESRRPAAGVPTLFEIVFRPSSDFFRYGQDPLMLLRDLSELGDLVEVAVDASQLPLCSELSPEDSFLGWRVLLLTPHEPSDVEDVFVFVNEQSTWTVDPFDLQREEPKAGESAASDARSADQPAADATGAHETGAHETGAHETGAHETGADETGADETGAVTVDTAGPLQRKPAPSIAPQRTESRATLRVDCQRVDELINQIGELVIGASMVEQDWLNSMGAPSQSIVQLGKIVRDLQEMSLGMRMVPVAATFQKMSRAVRDLSRQLGKKIQLRLVGEETELDKTVVDQIGDPLLHMVRNSADHGIEMPADRLANGKPAEGQIQVKAFHQGGNIYIVLEDDGRGLNTDAIREKAVERGIIGPEDKLSHPEICDLVFHPGLSTAATVSDVSGRGVGMDVVRRNIESLNGSVTLQSQPGKGTRTTVRLPLTLATLDGLTVRLGPEVFVIALASVVESVQPSSEDVRSVGARCEVVNIRGNVLPLVRLHQLFDVQGAVTDPADGIVVVVEYQDRHIALLVDELVGQQQVVIKNLETNFRRVPGIAGATILGDGGVALILDVDGLTVGRSGDGVPEKSNGVSSCSANSRATAR